MLSVGGVMGQNTDCLVVDCWNRGGLKIESSAPRSSSGWNAICAGGLVGYCEEPVYNSYNRGNISLIDAHIDVEGSSQGSVGGLVGKAKLLWNSYSTGDVYSDVAGVKVCRLSESNVHSCYYNSDAVVEGTEVGENGIAYSTAEMQSAGSGFLEALNNNATEGGIGDIFPGKTTAIRCISTVLSMEWIRRQIIRWVECTLQTDVCSYKAIGRCSCLFTK